MDNLQQQIVDTLQANGGRMPYRDLHAAIPPLELRRLPQALLRLKDSNVAVQRIVFDSETRSVSHTVELV